MADRPIIFSGPMVRALIAGTKTQTRRIIQNVRPDNCISLKKPSKTKAGTSTHVMDAPKYPRLLPVPAQIGGRLWVREAIQFDKQMDAIAPAQMSKYEPRVYLADNHLYEPASLMLARGNVRPSIHMPRWASRLTLTVTDVRVQRLQDISAADSIAEGVQCDTCKAMHHSQCHGKGCFASVAAFRALWNSLHGPDAWDANPWVVALTFTVHHGNIDAVKP